MLVWWAGACAQDPREDSGAVRSRYGDGVFALLRNTSTRTRGLRVACGVACCGGSLLQCHAGVAGRHRHPKAWWVRVYIIQAISPGCHAAGANPQTVAQQVFRLLAGALCEAQNMPWVQFGLLVQVCGMLCEKQCFQPGPEYIARTCHTTSTTISSESGTTTTTHSRSCSEGENEWCDSSLSKEVRRISLQPHSRAFIFRAVLGVR